MREYSARIEGVRLAEGGRVELAIDYLQYLNTHFRRWCLGIVRKYFQGGLQPKEDRG